MKHILGKKEDNYLLKLYWARFFERKFMKDLIPYLRNFYTPEEISQLTGKSKTAIDCKLCRLKKKGHTFPKLRHKRLKWDKQKAQELRQMVRNGMKYRQIQEQYSVDISIISRTLAAEARGELVW